MTGFAAAGDPHATIPGSELEPPTLQDVFLARQVVDRYLKPTPLLYSEALSRKLGFDLWLKCENLQPIGAFKIRGGIYLISKLSDAQKARGVGEVMKHVEGLNLKKGEKVADIGAGALRWEGALSLFTE